MRCRISGRFADSEIPLLVLSFCLFCCIAAECFTLVLELTDVCHELRERQRQVGSLAGAAHLLNDNTGVLREAQ